MLFMLKYSNKIKSWCSTYRNANSCIWTIWKF